MLVVILLLEQGLEAERKLRVVVEVVPDEDFLSREKVEMVQPEAMARAWEAQREAMALADLRNLVPRQIIAAAVVTTGVAGDSR